MENVISKFKINYFEQPKFEIEIAFKSSKSHRHKEKQPFFILEQFKKFIRRRRKNSNNSNNIHHLELLFSIIFSSKQLECSR